MTRKAPITFLSDLNAYGCLTHELHMHKPIPGLHVNLCKFELHVLNTKHTFKPLCSGTQLHDFDNFWKYNILMICDCFIKLFRNPNNLSRDLALKDIF